MAETYPAEEYRRLVRQNCIVRAATGLVEREGVSEVDALRWAIVALCRTQSVIQDRLALVEGLIPRRVRSGGTIHRWDAPDELVPVIDV